METLHLPLTTKKNLKISWTARIVKGLCLLFLLFDSIMKLIKESHSVEGTLELGWPEPWVQILGSILLFCTILYLIPQTELLGAILITGYLGGAIATMARIGVPFYFPLIFGLLIWFPLFLREQKLRSLLFLKKESKE